MDDERLQPDQIRAYNSDLGVACIAPESVFFPNYDDIPLEIRQMIEQAGGIPCEGGGVPGNWCAHGSRWGGCPWYRSADVLAEKYRIFLENLPTERDYGDESTR